MILSHWQEIATFFIVIAAGISVGRRVWAQAAAFGNATPDSKLAGEASACSGCDGCGPGKAAPAQPQLVNISLNAPRKIRPPRPGENAARRN